MFWTIVAALFFFFVILPILFTGLMYFIFFVAAMFELGGALFECFQESPAGFKIFVLFAVALIVSISILTIDFLMR